MASPWVAAGFIAGVGLTAGGMVLDQALVGIRVSCVQLYRNSYFSFVKLALLVMLAVTVGSRSQVTMVWAWVAGIAISMVATAWHLAARGYRLGQPVRLSALRGRGVTTFHHNTLNLSLTLPRLGLPLLVASLLGAHATAAFYAAWMITSFLYILPMHLSTALFAVAVGDIRALTPRLRAALRISLLLGGPVAVALAALAGPAMRSFGPDYEIARTALVVMAIAYFPNVFKQCYVAVARVDNRLRKAGAICSIGAALELCLTAAGAWFDGLTGISLGFLAAVTLQAVYYVPQVLQALRPGGQRAAPQGSSQARSQHAGSSAPSPGRAGGVATSAGPANPGTLCRREKGSVVVPGRSARGEVVQPRVFVDHSGYDLLNIGDSAMLKVTVTRLRERWPGARLQIVTTSRERLAALCPGTDPIIVMPDRGPVGLLPDRVRGAIGLRYKRAICACPWAAWRFSPGAGQLLDALRGCDLAVCSGGGFVNDTFPLHAAGVLAAMRSTQRRGVPTAMLGQGYGPLTSPPLADLAGQVIPQLTLISLRGPRGQRAVSELRAGRGELVVTGDDALELAGAGRLAVGPALGVNLRATAYAGLESGLGRPDRLGCGGRRGRAGHADAGPADLMASRRRGLAGAGRRVRRRLRGGPHRPAGTRHHLADRSRGRLPDRGHQLVSRCGFRAGPGNPGGGYLLDALLRRQIRWLAGTLRSAGGVCAGGEPGWLAGPDAEPRACGRRAGRRRSRRRGGAVGGAGQHVPGRV